jgi:hypothetical protein
MRRSVAAGLVAAGLLAGSGLIAWAQEDEEEENNPAGLAKVLPEASVSLEQGLKAGEREGEPISGKYELADGALQLSVYTMKGDRFEEVVVDHKSGAIAEAEPITEGDDLRNAEAQGRAIGQAKLPLDKAVDQAVKANGGFRAVRVIPSLKDGHPVADVTLMQGDNVKQVSEKLD